MHTYEWFIKRNEFIGDQRFLSMAPENIGKLLAAFIIQGGVKREH